MSTQHPDERLSDYIDGALDATQVAALEAHLAACETCRSTLEALHRVVEAAAALEDHEPATDLFPGIIERIRHDRRHRFSFTLPQLAAAAIAIMSLSGGFVWLAMRPESPAPGVAEAPAGGATSPTDAAATGPEAVAAMFVAETQLGYDAAIERLEASLAARRDRLDPATIAIIEHNLAIIDTAIAEAKAALDDDPANPYLYRHLDNTLNQKVELLRRASHGAAIQGEPTP